MDSDIRRKKCANCGEPIVGVIPRYQDGLPICRNCAFNQTRPQAKAQNRDNGDGKDRRAELAKAGRKRRYLWAIPFLLVLVAAFVVVRLVSTGVFEDEPLRRGGVKTDRGGDECVRNLWRLSKALQEGTLTGLALTCPSSDRPYSVVEVNGDRIISCPAPGSHKVSAMKVSRNKPIPMVTR